MCPFAYWLEAHKMNIHLLDLFTTQFTSEIAGKLRFDLDITITNEAVVAYGIDVASRLINELPKFYVHKENQTLLNDLVDNSPFVNTQNIFEDIDLRTSEVLRNGKYLAHGIYGVKHLDFLRMIPESYELTTEQAHNLWYISGSVILILINSLTNNENSLTDLISVIKKEVEAAKPKKVSSLFLGLLSF